MATKLRKSSNIKPIAVKAGRRVQYGGILSEVVGLREQARRSSARAVNAVMTTTYWQVGRHIVKHEQAGESRAGYGEMLIKSLAVDLTSRFGRGFSKRNLELMRLFYLNWPIAQTPSAQLKTGNKNLAVAVFPLPWSHYAELIRARSPECRQFYETEALRGGWTLKQLQRQIDSRFYERTALSRNKIAMLTKHAAARPQDATTPEEELKDPYVLEFLGLKDEYSEQQLEEALIQHLETFLLELGNDFAFVGRQRRLRVGDSWFRVDLLLFHRGLRCLVIIDLKTGALTPAHAGQMHMYCNYAAEHWTHADERPPVGLILCSEVNSAVAKYTLDGLGSKILAGQYRLTLPSEKLLAAEVEKTRRLLSTRRRSLDGPSTSKKSIAGPK